MTPQEHYAEAERLVGIANGDDPRDAVIVAAAQVHATLASTKVMYQPSAAAEGEVS